MGKSLRERRKNEKVRREGGVARIVDEVKDSRLRWFGHMKRMNDNDTVKLAWKEPVRGRRCIGRQRFRWRDGVERDMREIELEKGDVMDRDYWYRRTRAAGRAKN